MKRLRVISTIFFMLLLFTFMSNSFAQIEWTKHGSPVLLPGSAGEWDDDGFISPFVIFDETTYKMWYGASDGTTFRIGYATSPDGINWTKYNDPTTVNPPYAESDPVLNIGPGAWENSWVYAQILYFDDTTYHMWYGGTDGNSDRVGYATSPDGITWTKNPANPVINLGPSGSWDDTSVDPGPIHFDGTTFEMIYNGFDGLHYQGGYATSPDGINWTKSADPILPYGQPGSWDNPRVQPGSVIYNSYTSTYYLFYSGGPLFNWRIRYATASDFSGPWTKNDSILLDVTPGSFDSDVIAFPCVIEDLTSNLYKMWYVGGSSGSGSAIGYARSPITPVELTSFSAEALDQKVILKWSTATELNNNGFEVQRKVAESDFATIGFVKGEGTTTDQKDYSFVDKDLIDGKYFYRLKQVDYNGTYEYSDVIEVDVRSLNEYVLEQNYPNPFNPTTTIGYVLKEKSSTNMILLNVIGEEIAVLVNEEQDKGFHKVDFNAVNLPSGVYFYRLQAGDFVETRKMILLK